MIGWSVGFLYRCFHQVCAPLRLCCVAPDLFSRLVEGFLLSDLVTSCCHPRTRLVRLNSFFLVALDSEVLPNFCWTCSDKNQIHVLYAAVSIVLCSDLVCFEYGMDVAVLIGKLTVAVGDFIFEPTVRRR